jgi:alpha-ketoglutarate-dependent taurine dioxygenase
MSFQFILAEATSENMIAAVTPMHDAPFQGRGAWRGSDFADPGAWTYRLPPPAVAELDRAMRNVRHRRREISTLTMADFPAPCFSGDAATLRREVQSGRGFVVIGGLPIDSYSDEEAAILYWGIATYLGTPIPQNVKEEHLFSVRDEGYNFQRDYGATGVRISRTASAIDFHTDSSAAYAGYTPDIVSLLALQTAKAGGATGIVSAQTVHNILREERPDYVKRLYSPYYFDRRAELRAGESPTLLAPVFTCGDSLAIRYFRFNLMKGHETATAPLTPADTDPLDYLESVFRREDLAVTFQMERGDMQFVNNRFVLHSRTAFEDHAEPERRRNFLRLWMRYQDAAAGR